MNVAYRWNLRQRKHGFAALDRPAFTLVEIMVVTVLMTLLVSAAALRWDGIGEATRLRSAARQVGAFVRMAQSQAQTSGMPRLLEYLLQEDWMRLKKPHMKDGRPRWHRGAKLRTNTGVAVERVLVEGKSEPDEHAKIRIAGDGSVRSHAVVLRLGETCAVVLLENSGLETYRFPERCPQSTSLELLLLEMQNE